jgi:hypothetical protein
VRVVLGVFVALVAAAMLRGVVNCIAIPPMMVGDASG